MVLPGLNFIAFELFEALVKHWWHAATKPKPLRTVDNAAAQRERDIAHRRWIEEERQRLRERRVQTTVPIDTVFEMWAQDYNVLRIQSGMAGLAYAN